MVRRPPRWVERFLTACLGIGVFLVTDSEGWTKHSNAHRGERWVYASTLPSFSAMDFRPDGVTTDFLSSRDAFSCSGAYQQWDGGHACCPIGGIVRPGLGRCASFMDLSPIVDPVRGIFRARLDPQNWIDPSQGNVLELLAWHVVDNAEGEEWPHGPYGSLYFDVFSSREKIQQSRDYADHRVIAKPRHLRGPHRTHDTTDEWLDDEVLQYEDAGLFRWKNHGDTSSAVVIRVWESDYSSDDGFLGRRNDVLGMERIERAKTETTCGTWVPFYKYTNDHPRQRTSTISAWALLRTSKRGALTTACRRTR